jgi:hypothetical protein
MKLGMFGISKGPFICVPHPKSLTTHVGHVSRNDLDHITKVARFIISSPAVALGIKLVLIYLGGCLLQNTVRLTVDLI